MKLHVKINEQTYEVEIGDLSARPVLAVVDGETFEVWPEEAQSEPAPALAARPAPAIPAQTSPPAAPLPVRAPSGAGVDRGKVVAAPIPGTIVNVCVKEGDQINLGQELFTLEAMKMKNAIRANRSGKIGKVLVNLGDRVNQGQPLIEYAD